MNEDQKRPKGHLRENEINELEAKIDVLKAKLVQAKLTSFSEIEEQVQTLHAKRLAIAEQIDRLRQATEGAWEEVSHGVDEAWDEFKQAYEDLADGVNAAVVRFKGTGNGDEPEA